MIDFGKRGLIARQFRRSQLARREGNAELLCERLGQTLPDRAQIGHEAEQVGQIGNPLPRRSNRLAGKFLGRNAQYPQHFFHVELHQQRTLVQQGIALERAAGAGNFPALHLDVVTRAVPRLDPQSGDSPRRGFADAAGNQGHVGTAEIALGQVELPADLGFIEIDRPAAGDAALHGNGVGAAVVEIEFLLRALVVAEQRARTEAQEAQSIGNFTGLARFKQGAVEGDVLRRRPQAGIDDAPGSAHFSTPIITSLPTAIEQQAEAIRAFRPSRAASSTMPSAGWAIPFKPAITA